MDKVKTSFYFHFNPYTFMKALWWARAVVGRLPVAPGFESGLRVKAIPGHSMEAGCTHVHPRIYPHSHQSH